VGVATCARTCCFATRRRRDGSCSQAATEPPQPHSQLPRAPWWGLEPDGCWAASQRVKRLGLGSRPPSGERLAAKRRPHSQPAATGPGQKRTRTISLAFATSVSKRQRMSRFHFGTSLFGAWPADLALIDSYCVLTPIPSYLLFLLSSHSFTSTIERTQQAVRHAALSHFSFVISVSFLFFFLLFIARSPFPSAGLESKHFPIRNKILSIISRSTPRFPLYGINTPTNKLPWLV